MLEEEPVVEEDDFENCVDENFDDYPDDGLDGACLCHDSYTCPDETEVYPAWDESLRGM